MSESADADGVQPLWQDGWLNSARRFDSPNFGARPAGACIDLIVLHSISLPPGCFGSDAVLRLFRNELDWDAHPYFGQIRGIEVSAHFFLRRDGALWQCVSCDQRAWHAGASCWRGRSNCNDDSIGIELEGLEGELFRARAIRRADGFVRADCAALSGAARGRARAHCAGAQMRSRQRLRMGAVACGHRLAGCAVPTRRDLKATAEQRSCNAVGGAAHQAFPVSVERTPTQKTQQRRGFRDRIGRKAAY